MTSREYTAWLAVLARSIPRKWRLQNAIHCAGSMKVERDKRAYFWAKRLLDFSVSVIMFVFLMPILLIVALAIKLDSPGPVLFGQQRMGYDWRKRKLQPFMCYKFRSMFYGCDETPHRAHVQRTIHEQSSASDPDGNARLVKLPGDCRVTRVGRILRKTSIDELPQLWNILRGEMSLVGPRPVPLYEVAAYAPQHFDRLQATPGLTGLWQINGRGRTTIDEMVAMDVDYINRQSLWLDLYVLLLTVPVALSMHGAE